MAVVTVEWSQWCSSDSSSGDSDAGGDGGKMVTSGDSGVSDHSGDSGNGDSDAGGDKR